MKDSAILKVEEFQLGVKSDQGAEFFARVRPNSRLLLRLQLARQLDGELLRAGES